MKTVLKYLGEKIGFVMDFEKRKYIDSYCTLNQFVNVYISYFIVYFSCRSLFIYFRYSILVNGQGEVLISSKCFCPGLLAV